MSFTQPFVTVSETKTQTTKKHWLDRDSIYTTKNFSPAKKTNPTQTPKPRDIQIQKCVTIQQNPSKKIIKNQKKQTHTHAPVPRDTYPISKARIRILRMAVAMFWIFARTTFERRSDAKTPFHGGGLSRSDSCRPGDCPRPARRPPRASPPVNRFREAKVRP